MEKRPSLQPFRLAATSLVTDCTLSARKFGLPSGGKSQSLFSGKAASWPLEIHVLTPRASAGWVAPGPDATISGREGWGSS